MSRRRNKDLGLDRPIVRRDFLQGAAIGIGAAASTIAPAFTASSPPSEQNDKGYYPPERLGMRGSHPGSFEAAHALRDGDFWNHAHGIADIDEPYDLVVVGAGISGLSAAYFWRKHNPRSRVLVLENHDDFGGHARRNEFHLAGRTEIINGGTLDIDSPTPYAPPAAALLKELGIDPVALSKTCNVPAIYESLGLSSGFFFDRETFGADRLVRLEAHRESATPVALKAFLARAPLSERVKGDIFRIEFGTTDYFPGLSSDQKKERLSRLSYQDYLLKIVKADKGAIPFYFHRTDGLWGCGIDAISALDCWGIDLPGFRGLKLAPGGTKRMGYTPAGYASTGGSPSFHFPDGNASIARLLVRRLVPDAMPGSTVEDVVTARANYGALDRPTAPVRIRLNSLAVRVRNHGSNVEIAYTRSAGGGAVMRVRGKTCVLAGWNMMIPYLVPELPAAQKEALHKLIKTPLVYASVALRNWEAFARLKVRSVFAPGSYFSAFALNEPVNIGSYKSPVKPSEPILVRMERTPASPGLPEREQHKAGRYELLSTPFETFERNIRDELGRALSTGGFDPARDIAGIAVNRWPHGYAPEYNSLCDGDTTSDKTPNLVARARFGQIAIANADAGMAAYTDVAIDQAWRAVSELLG